ncbi:uncharacterized protein [Antedon mediterranea]|uniref:uncharacterized protein n=1 Tax=Antedon mediterranea TaxID=105859 RepID=UPI003AF5F9C5
MRKPQMEIKKFAGESLEFKRFIRQFKSRVEQFCSADEKLQYLEQFTTGEAHRIVKGFSYLDADTGYPSAIKELTERYGDPEVIANAFVKKLYSWPVLRSSDSKSLDDFAIFLKECEAATQCVGSLAVLEFFENLKTIVTNERWRGKVYDLKAKHERVKFSDLVEFVRKEAKKSNDPVYGKLQLDARGNKFKESSKVSAVNVKQVEKCLCCERPHSVAQCSEMKRMAIQERFEMLKRKNVCFLCLVLTSTAPKHAVPISVTDGSSCVTSEGKLECTLAVIAVKVCVGWKCTLCYAFLDPGSNVSFCSQRLMTELGVQGKKRSITLDTMLNSQLVETCTVDGLIVSDIEGNSSIRMPAVYNKDKIPVKIEHIPTMKDIEQWGHLHDVKLHQLSSNATIDLLIGNNVPDAYTPSDIRTGPPSSPHATKTALGWIPWNVIRIGNTTNVNSSFINVAISKHDESESLERTYRESLKYDFPERVIDDKREWSQEDKRFIKIMADSCNFVDGHYQMELPLRDKKLKIQDYVKFMTSVIDQGYAEEVSPYESQDGLTWYIPHHGVYHPKKPTKIRVVFDCAARYLGVALNDLLLCGPNLLNNLNGILLRFRQHPVAFMSDIETMFYQVKVPKKHRNLFRFFWWPGGDLEATPIKYRMTVHLFGATSSPSYANFALQQTAKDNQKLHSKAAVSTVLNDFYMDDCLRSVESTQKALGLIQELKNLCQKGGFNLTKWVCTNKYILSQIPVEDRTKGVMNLDLDHSPLPKERALGFNGMWTMTWFVAPVSVSAKNLLQDLCKLKLGWDERIPDEHAMKWQNWCKQICLIESVTVPRCYVPGSNSHFVNTQVHAFSDASAEGYGCVIYLRQISEQGKIRCSFVTGKARVAPIKKVTIPRMELTAATMSVKICAVVLRELDIKLHQTFYWTDSTSVLRYIANESSRFHTFVSNRVTIIRSATSINQWKFVDTKQNPADVASRGQNPKQFLSDPVWLQGPRFLLEDEGKWPQQIISMKEDSRDCEVKASHSTQVNDINHPVCILVEHYSSWHSLKKAVAYILKVKGVLLRKIRGATRSHTSGSHRLTVRDLHEAEMLIVKHVQRKFYSEEMEVLQRGTESNTMIVSRSSPL